jgi:hypothetical protein
MLRVSMKCEKLTMKCTASGRKMDKFARVIPPERISDGDWDYLGCRPVKRQKDRGRFETCCMAKESLSRGNLNSAAQQGDSKIALPGCRFGESRHKSCERFAECWVIDLLNFHVPEEHLRAVFVANDLEVKQPVHPAANAAHSLKSVVIGESTRQVLSSLLDARYTGSVAEQWLR